AGAQVQVDQLLLVKDDPLQLVVGHLVVVRHGDGLEGAGFDAQVAEHAAAHVDGKLVDVELLSALRLFFAGGFDVDHLGRTGPGTGLAAHALELAGVPVDGEHGNAAKAVGGLPALFGVLDSDGRLEQVLERKAHSLDQAEAAVEDALDVVGDVVAALAGGVLAAGDHRPAPSRHLPPGG